jgi:hypothetical protein
MGNCGSTIPLAANNDIVEMMIRGRLYWVTRKQFFVLAETSAMLETVISGGGKLPTIHHIFDEAKTMADMHTRFSKWQAERLGEPTILPFKATRKPTKPVSPRTR